jgi:Flp pilus assembly secretin CpaC/tetratricopeptide (TPR) repeat protein
MAQDGGAANPAVSKEAAKDAAGNGDDATLQDLESLFGGAAAQPAEGDKQGTTGETKVDESVKKDVDEAIESGEDAPKADGEKTATTPAPKDVIEPEPTELSENEKVRRQEQELMADEFVVQGNQLYRSGDYSGAVSLYKQAKAALERVSKKAPRILRKQDMVDVVLHNLYRDWAYDLVQQARRDVRTENVDSAIEKLNKARGYDPSKSEEIDALIKKYLQVKDSLSLKEQTRPDRVDPDQPDRVFQMKVLVDQGRVFLKNRRYADARDKFEQVLLLDPYDITAIRLLRQINVELSEVARDKRDAMVEEAMAEVAWKWASPVTPLLAGPAGTVGSRTVRKTGEDLSGIRKKLQDIILPHVEFDEVPIKDVVKALKEMSVQLDPDGEGVNIFLHLRARKGAAGGGGMEGGGGAAPGGDMMPGGMEGGMGGDMGGDMGGGMGGGMGGAGGMGGGMGPEGGMGGDMGGGMGGGMGAGGGFGGGFDATTPAPTDDFTMPDATTGPAAAQSQYEDLSDTPIILNMDNISLGEVIRYICLGAGLKERIEEDAVLILHPKNTTETMETRFYSVAAGVLDTQRTRKKASGIDWGSDDDDNGDDDDDDDNGDDDDDDESKYIVNVQQFFESFGVQFPFGARISYYSRTGKLVVHNTSDNLRKVERILQEINITPTQVTIEAKFVEVDQTSLESLGFDWTLLGGVTSVSALGDDGWLLEGDQIDNGVVHAGDYFQVGVSKGSQLTEGLRFTNEVSGFGTSDDALFSVYSVLGNYAFETVLHALSQKTQSDVLSSPKVTTLSGKTAILRMVEERYFPSSWTEPEISTTGSGDNVTTSYTPSIPEFDEARDVGVILEVTPTVAADQYSITLELSPEVVDHVGWDDYSYDMIISNSTVRANAMMPILSSRTVETQVIVWDGESVVLGGMIKERVTKYNDKVPVLGELPLIGPLFQSRGENSEKINLLIFVTARLVTPAGLPRRPNETRGLPDFRR